MEEKQLKSKFKVSAVIPVYNAEKTLEKAVNSLLIQPEIAQIILVEDGSMDASLEICNRLKKSNPNITLLQHPNGENRGAPASRNLGLSQVIHPWVQFMDADDELLPGKIADQLECIQGEECLIVGKFSLGETGEQINPFSDIWSGLLATRLGNTVANLWNTLWVREAGSWNTSLPNVQEYHLMLEMLKLNDQISFSKSNRTIVFPQPNSISNSFNKKDKKRDTYFQFRRLVRDYLRSKNLFTFKRRHYYIICTGQNLRYHQPNFSVPFNRYYYSIYRNLKLLKDKIS